MENNNQLFLPDGLPVTASEPEWLSEAWPMSMLDSSIGSLIVVILIFAGLSAVFFLISLLSKAFLPHTLKGLVRAVFLLLGVGSLVASVLTVMSWNREHSIGDYDMGVQVLKVSEWLDTKGVQVDNRTAWDLVCEFYDEKNSHCRDQRVTVEYKKQREHVNLQRVPDGGNVALYDYEELVPLVQ